MDNTPEPVVRDYTEIFHVMKYPAGEFHVSIKHGAPIGHYHNTMAIIWPARDYNDLCTILLAWETYRRHMGEGIRVVVPYFPFARHDRRNGAGDSNPLQFAIKLMQPMIDAGDLIIIDPHSDVSGVIPHINQTAIVRQLNAEGQIFHNFATVVIPDAGATKKTLAWLPNLGNRHAQGLKHRDTTTGHLSGFGVQFPVGMRPMPGDPVVIVDDICDGGGTFLGLMQEVDEVMPEHGKAILAVTHGLFTKGLTDLLHVFDEIWTLDIYRDPTTLPDTAAIGMHYIDTKALIAKAIETDQIQ